MLNKNDNCIFCKIVAGEIPSYKVYEDEYVLGFLTIHPHTKGHTLVIPKNHSYDLLELPESEILHMNLAGQKIGKKIKSIFDCKKISFAIVGLEVDHPHLHVFPINEIADIDLTKGYVAETSELIEMQEKIKIN